MQNLAWMKANIWANVAHICFPCFLISYIEGETRFPKRSETSWWPSGWIPCRWSGGGGQKVGLNSVLKSIKIICLKYPFTNLLSFSATDRLHWWVADSRSLNQTVFTAHCKWGVRKVSLGGGYGSLCWRRGQEGEEAAGEGKKSYIQRESVREGLGFHHVHPKVRLSAQTKPVLKRWRNLMTTQMTPGFGATKDFDRGKKNHEGRWEMSSSNDFHDQNCIGQMEALAEQKEMTHVKYWSLIQKHDFHSLLPFLLNC